MARRLFGSIIQRGKNYHGRYRKDGKDYYTPTQPTKTQVRRDLDLVRAQILTGEWIDPTSMKAKTSDMTVANFYDAWIGDLEAGDYSPNTVRTYASHWRKYVLPKYGARLLSDFDSKAIAAIRDNILENRSATTAGNVLRSIRAGLGYATEKEWLDALPEKLPTVSKRKTPGGAGYAYSREELEKLIQACVAYYQPALIFGAYGCLRIGEVSALRRDDIDAVAGTVRVDEAVKRGLRGEMSIGAPKSQAGYRTVNLPERYLPIIAGFLDEHVPVSPRAFLYPSTKQGGIQTGRPILRAFQDACKKTGVHVGRFHDLRHSGLTLYGQAGATLADLMARAGHANAETVMIYQHSTLERDRHLANLM